MFLLIGLLAGASHAVAHTGTRELIGWKLDPWIIAGLATAAGLYACGIARLWRHAHAGAGVPVWRAGCFGIGILALALLSPLDAIGAALFSMHMIQHELIMVAAAPLLVAGHPLPVLAWVWPQGARRITGAVRPAWQVLMQPLVATAVHALVLWAWHFPRLFQAGVTSDVLHAMQHASFLFAALLFWAALTRARSRERHASAVLYLLVTAIHTGVLGALLTFSTRVWYPLYAVTAPDWGLTALEDQQLGGLIMWVPAGFVFVVAGLACAARAIAPARARRA